MFTPNIISKELVEPHVVDRNRKTGRRTEKKINRSKRLPRGETINSTVSDSTQFSSSTSEGSVQFTPYLISDPHTKPLVAEREETARLKHEEDKIKRGEEHKSSEQADYSTLSRSNFTPYIISKRHVRAQNAA